MTAIGRDRLVLAAILALAAGLRLIALPRRGEWDDDQGIEMLAMLGWVRDGRIPLLGPVSSAPTVHHGAWFYWILAPGAFATDAHPMAAVATLAVIGIGGVAAAWWLGRTVGGPLAGHLTGLLMAVSPAAITASTYVWNANIVAPGAALASAAAWQAWRTRRARWWLLSAVGGVLMLSGHLLAAVALPSFAALMAADLLRRPRSEWPWLPMLGAIGIVTVGYLPSLVQWRAVVDFLATHDPGGPSLPARLVIISRRVLAWPVSGFADSAPWAGWLTTLLKLAALVLTIQRAGPLRQFGCWAAATTGWSVLALAVLAPTLATPYAGLPTDQYHAWLEPILLAAIGTAGAQLWRAKVVAIALVGACIALSLISLPPLSSPDGGWPRAAATATRIRAVTGDHTVAVAGVGKSGAALEFPLRRAHSPGAGFAAAEFLVVTCDPLFFRVSVLPCGGQAEAAAARELGFPRARVVDRFADGPRRVISIFASH